MHKDHAKNELIYEARPGYENRNRCSFSRFLKVKRDGAEVTSAGRSFHCKRQRQGRHSVQLAVWQQERVDRRMKKTAVFVETGCRRSLCYDSTWPYTVKIIKLDLDGIISKSVRVVEVEFNAPPDTIQVLSEAVFTANHLTDTDKRNTTGKYTE